MIAKWTSSDPKSPSYTQSDPKLAPKWPERAPARLLIRFLNLLVDTLTNKILCKNDYILCMDPFWPDNGTIKPATILYTSYMPFDVAQSDFKVDPKSPSYAESHPKVIPKCPQSRPHASKVTPKWSQSHTHTPNWSQNDAKVIHNSPHISLKSLKSVGKMGVFRKCTFVYPKWLHNDPTVIPKWPKATIIYPKCPQSGTKVIPKSPP